MKAAPAQALAQMAFNEPSTEEVVEQSVPATDHSTSGKSQDRRRAKAAAAKVRATVKAKATNQVVARATAKGIAIAMSVAGARAQAGARARVEAKRCMMVPHIRVFKHTQQSLFA